MFPIILSFILGNCDYQEYGSDPQAGYSMRLKRSNRSSFARYLNIQDPLSDLSRPSVPAKSSLPRNNSFNYAGSSHEARGLSVSVLRKRLGLLIHTADDLHSFELFLKTEATARPDLVSTSLLRYLILFVRDLQDSIHNWNSWRRRACSTFLLI